MGSIATIIIIAVSTNGSHYHHDHYKLHRSFSCSILHWYKRECIVLQRNRPVNRRGRCSLALRCVLCVALLCGKCSVVLLRSLWCLRAHLPGEGGFSLSSARSDIFVREMFDVPYSSRGVNIMYFSNTENNFGAFGKYYLDCITNNKAF